MLLATLIVVAVAATLPLGVKTLGLPSNGAYFNASQGPFDRIAVACLLGLACAALGVSALIMSKAE